MKAPASRNRRASGCFRTGLAQPEATVDLSAGTRLSSYALAGALVSILLFVGSGPAAAVLDGRTLGFDEAFELADVIAYGEILESSMDSRVSVFRLDDVLKGKGLADTVEIWRSLDDGVGAGGVRDELVFAPGDAFVLFLAEIDGPGGYRLVGGYDVNQRIDHWQQTPDGESLAALTKRIRDKAGVVYAAAKSFRVEEASARFEFADLLPKRGAKDAGKSLEGAAPVRKGGATTIFYDGFEGAFPGMWNVFDNNGATGGDVYWDDTNYRSDVGSWSVWCADEGADHGTFGGNYLNNMDTVMIYGPFSLSDATAASFSLRYWNISEQGFDFFRYFASADGANFSGFQVSGNSNGWQSASLDLSNVPTLGDLTGDSSVWVALWFVSDGSVTADGAYVDEVRVEKIVSTGPDLEVTSIDAPSGTFAPGDPITIGNTVTNIGGTASGGYRITFYASDNTIISSLDQEIGHIDRPSLGPGAAHVFNSSGNLPGNLPNGQYYIGAQITMTSDTNGANNTNYDPVPITVNSAPPPAADLEVTSIDVPSGTFAPGDPISIGNVVTNVGNASSAGYRITFYASDNTVISSQDYEIGFVDRGGLPAGQAHNFNSNGNLPSNLPDDEYYIGAVITISDANSGNNSNYDPNPITVSSGGGGGIPGGCIGRASSLYLQSNRFLISGAAFVQGQPSTFFVQNICSPEGVSNTAAAFFFNTATPVQEGFVSVRNECSSGRFAWIVEIASASTRRFWVDVTDTFTGHTERYENPRGGFSSFFPADGFSFANSCP